MDRDIDRLIEFINDADWLPPVHKHVLIARVEKPPTDEEIQQAKQLVPGYAS